MFVTVRARYSDDWKTLLKRAFAFGGVKGVKVGIDETAVNSETGVRIAEYAAYNEFGTQDIPARPFMRLTVERHVDEWWQLFIRIAGDRVLHDPKVGVRALTAVGEKAVEDMRATIMSDVPPPNAPETIRRKIAKGNSYIGTLYDTGEMYRSVIYHLCYSDAELKS